MSTSTPNAESLSAGNVYENVGGVDGDAEQFTSLLRDKDVHIEKIVSHGGDTHWFDQDTVEFVVLLRGGARMLFDGESDEHVLKAGDFVVIPKHKRHRVTSTARGEPTVWLAFHWK